MKKINNISKFYFCLSALLLIYIGYKSEIVAKGLKYDYYIDYYIASLVLIFFSFVSLFLKKELNIKIFLIVISIILSFYLVELFLTGKKLLTHQVLDNQKFMTEFKKKDPKIVPIVFTSKFRDDKNQKTFPLSGVSKKMTNLGNENGYWAIYKSDRYGFNNPDKLWDEDNIDFVIVGDSFVHGMSVFDKDSFRGNIEKKSRRGVINLGWSGNGPLTELATLREYFPKKNIKHVIWFYYEENDIADLLNERTNKILNKYLDDPNFTQGLRSQQKYLDNILLKHISEEIELQKFKLLQVILQAAKLSSTRFFIHKKITYKKNIFQIPSEFWKIINRAKTFSEKNGSKFYFVYIPDKSRYTHNLQNDFEYRHYGKIIKKVEGMNIPTVDLNKEFSTFSVNPLELYAPESFHLNEKGYALGAEIILNKIKGF